MSRGGFNSAAVQMCSVQQGFPPAAHWGSALWLHWPLLLLWLPPERPGCDSSQGASQLGLCCSKGTLRPLPGTRLCKLWICSIYMQVCSTCSQLLTALQRRPLISIQSVNSSLYSVVHGISEIEVSLVENDEAISIQLSSFVILLFLPPLPFSLCLSICLPLPSSFPPSLSLPSPSPYRHYGQRLLWWKGT